MTEMTCPDCKTTIGELHRNECDVERCAECGSQRITCSCENSEGTLWAGDWPDSSTANNNRIETQGFVIYNIDADQTIVHKPKDPPNPYLPQRPVSDEMRSASARMEYHTHVLEPVYQDGKQTGKWRVYFFRRGTRPFKDIPWDRNFNSQKAAEKWVESVLEELGERK